ncbi:MAG: type II toxin-antitoxin system VapC family toxin [Candidatus Lokiarchaeota archaeon]|nr:type II toxin-antitoxin system VapC family toxin [Candidatus Lokiarchaeota archaeon]
MEAEIVLYIDANIFLELLLNQASAPDCQRFLSFLETSMPSCIISSFHVFAIVLVIQHKAKNMQLSKRFLESLQSYSGISIYHADISTMTAAVDLQVQHHLDFDDGLAIAAMREMAITKIVSFDAHFDHVSSIKRIGPADALKELQQP